jgi:hypothetical protein
MKPDEMASKEVRTVKENNREFQQKAATVGMLDLPGVE